MDMATLKQIWEDIKTLDQRLRKLACRQPGTCPHGRPIAVRITLEDINKQFLRGGI